MSVHTMLRLEVRVTCATSGISVVLTKTESAAHLLVLDDCLCTEVIDGKASGRVYMNADIIRTELYRAA